MSYDVENMNQALKIIYCEPVEKTYMDALEKQIKNKANKEKKKKKKLVLKE